MSELRIRLDPLNPGQFYACCGVLELAAREDPALVSRFEPAPGRPRILWCCIRGDLRDNFLPKMLGALRRAALTFDERFQEETIRPATLAFEGHTLELDWWLDEFREKASNVKCWAGQVTTRKLFTELLSLLDESASAEDLFEKSEPTKSKFGVDPRAAWNARDCGYSPNEHGKDAMTFIAVEVLAALGLQTFRPKVQRNRTAAYHLWTADLPLCVARTASCAPWNGLPNRGFQFSIGSRGQSYKYFKFGEPLKQTEEIE